MSSDRIPNQRACRAARRRAQSMMMVDAIVGAGLFWLMGPRALLGGKGSRRMRGR